jgi:Calcineurin-like phosphoesterase
MKHYFAWLSGRWRAWGLLSLAAVLAGGLAVLWQEGALPGQDPVAQRPRTESTRAASVAERSAPNAYASFAEWKAACDRLPSNRALRFRLPKANLLPLKSFSQFAKVLNEFFRVCKTGDLAESSAWLGQGPLTPQFFNTHTAYFLKPPIPFQPFVQRILAPPGAQFMFHGDLHGDIHSLVAWVDWLNQKGCLRGFRIARPDVYLVLLGDYTDRGVYGIEVLYTLLRLKVENPDRVLLVRGNHEDVSLAARYGFISECRGKFGRDFDLKRVMRLYDFLPVALYLSCGTNVIQCNHGGMEPGFDPRPLLDAPDPVRFQLLGRLNQQQFLKSHLEFASGLSVQSRRLMQNGLLDFQPQSPIQPWVIGFMWNDFSVVRGEPQFDFDPGRAFVYGESTTKYLLNAFSTPKHRIQAVFRAHQHATILNGMMRRLKVGHGIYRHWQEHDSVALMEAGLPVIAQNIELSDERRIPSGSVWTFNVVPDSVYGEACDFSFDTFGILTTASAFEDWRLRVVNQTIP